MTSETQRLFLDFNTPDEVWTIVLNMISASNTGGVIQWRMKFNAAKKKQNETEFDCLTRISDLKAEILMYEVNIEDIDFM